MTVFTKNHHDGVYDRLAAELQGGNFAAFKGVSTFPVLRTTAEVHAFLAPWPPAPRYLTI